MFSLQTAEAEPQFSRRFVEAAPDSVQPTNLPPQARYASRKIREKYCKGYVMSCVYFPEGLCRITINVPVVFMARYIMVLRGATSLRGALEGVGPENRDFARAISGPKKVEKSTYSAV